MYLLVLSITIKLFVSVGIVLKKTIQALIMICINKKQIANEYENYIIKRICVFNQVNCVSSIQVSYCRPVSLTVSKGPLKA